MAGTSARTASSVRLVRCRVERRTRRVGVTRDGGLFDLAYAASTAGAAIAFDHLTGSAVMAILATVAVAALGLSINRTIRESGRMNAPDGGEADR